MNFLFDRLKFIFFLLLSLFLTYNFDTLLHVRQPQTVQKLVTLILFTKLKSKFVLHMQGVY